MYAFSLIANIAAVTMTLCFIIAYSSVRWERSAEGINAMLISASLLILGIIGLIRKTVVMDTFEFPIIGGIYTIIAILMTHRIYLFIRAQRNHNNKNLKKGE